MGFFDSVKKAAGSAVNAVDKATVQIAQKASDSELKELLKKNPNNKYAREEANKRGI